MSFWLAMALQVVTSTGVHDLTLERADQEPVDYTLSLPEGFRDGEPRPLVVALHFAGRNRRHFGRGILTGLVEPGLRRLDAIIVAPDNLGKSWTNEASERAVLDLIDFLTAHYRIDPGRVVLTGYSMGGMGTWYIGARNPGRFSAAIPVAGAPRGLSDDDLNAFEKLPLYAIHSLADTVVPIEPTQEAVAALTSSGATTATLEIVEDITHYNVPAFAPHLEQAAGWIVREVWK